LDKNNGIFAWATSDLIGVSKSIVEHKLYINPSAKPKRKKKKLRKMSEEKVATAKVKIQWLLEAGFIREVKYPTWLANVVMVKKKNGKLRMCTYYIDLNKCFPKDDLPLSRIGKVVNSAAGCETMTLLDCFSDNHQIWLQKKR
jgi:hypothetical protein